jgi:hypothetical protein
LNLDQVSRLRPLQHYPTHPPFREPDDLAYRHWSHLGLRWGRLRYHLFKLSLNLPYQRPGWLHLGREPLTTNLVDGLIQAASCFCQQLTRFVSRMGQLEPSFRIDLRHFGLVVSTSLSGEVAITLDLTAQLLKRLELALQAIGDFHQPMLIGIDMHLGDGQYFRRHAQTLANGKALLPPKCPTRT